MTYPETVEYLFTRLPMYQRQGAPAFKKDLTNTLRLLQFLDNPHKQFQSVHVAGTNGKGSVTHMIAAALQTAGYKTGVYCSPHLLDFRERIKLDGNSISKGFVMDFVSRIQPAIEEIEPSFFEISVAMAFDYFAAGQVDIAIVEVGMGGRLDSTNVLQPLLSVITNISFDHQQFLGDTLAEIAAEKAGIVKKNTPVVIGRRQPQTTGVFQSKAAELNAPLTFAEDQFAARLIKASLSDMTIALEDPSNGSPIALVVETGATYQIENVVTAFVALNQLKDKLPRLDDKSIHTGISRFKEISQFIGRWQVLQESNPMILADCAHNYSALEVVFAQVLSLRFDRLHCVIGTVNDKDLDKFFSILPRQAEYYFCCPNVPRGLNARALQQAAHSKGFEGTAYPTVEQAYGSAIRAAGSNDLVYVGGSIFVVAEII